MGDIGYRDTDEFLVCFCDPKRPYPFFNLFKPGFRHIVLYLKQGQAWVERDPMRNKTKLKAIIYPGWNLQENATIVEAHQELVCISVASVTH